VTFASKRYAAIHYHLGLITCLLLTASCITEDKERWPNSRSTRVTTTQSTASPHRHLVGCDGWGSMLTIYIANSPIIIDHHRSPTLREAIDFLVTTHFQMASTACTWM